MLFLIAESILVKSSEEDSGKAQPIIEEKMDNIKTFGTLQAGGFIQTKSETVDAIKKEKKELYNRIMAFDFEKQLENQVEEAGM